MKQIGVYSEFLGVWLLLLGACSPQLDNSSPTNSNTLTPPSPPDSAQFMTPLEVSIPVNENEMTRARIWPGTSTSSSKSGIIFVSGVDGGFIEPVDGIYGRTAEKLTQEGVSSILVEYRVPGELIASIEDTLAAARYLRNLGVTRMALVGWSFGGAVMIHSALQIPEVVTLVGFAAQSKDTEPISFFSNQSVLLFHSAMDENVPFEAAQQILDSAPSNLHHQFCALEEADHLLSGTASQIDPVFQRWLRFKLLSPQPVTDEHSCSA